MVKIPFISNLSWVDKSEEAVSSLQDWVTMVNHLGELLQGLNWLKLCLALVCLVQPRFADIWNNGKHPQTSPGLLLDEAQR